eukprot:764845-Hanusia_phi.AAC.1
MASETCSGQRQSERMAAVLAAIMLYWSVEQYVNVNSTVGVSLGSALYRPSLSHIIFLLLCNRSTSSLLVKDTLGGEGRCKEGCPQSSSIPSSSLSVPPATYFLPPPLPPSIPPATYSPASPYFLAAVPVGGGGAAGRGREGRRGGEQMFKRMMRERGGGGRRTRGSGLGGGGGGGEERRGEERRG